MPNWVLNELVLIGPPQALADACASMGSPNAESADDRLLDFGRVVPIPDDVVGREPTGRCMFGPHEGGMDQTCWTTENWGTKWKAQSIELHGDPTGRRVEFRFETAWSPAIPIVRAISQAHADLSIEFKYLDPSVHFAGVVRHQAGGSWGTAEADNDVELCWKSSARVGSPICFARRSRTTSTSRKTPISKGPG